MAIYYNNARALHYIRTTDGGLSWTEVVFTGQPGYNRVVALTGLPGTYLSTDFRYPGASNLTSGRIVISRDHGSSWQNLYTNVISGAVSRIVVVSPTEIWAGVDAPGYQLNEPMAMRFAGTLLSGRVATPALRVAGYPNPTTGLVELQGEMAGEEGVCVYDALGRLCQQDKVSPSRRTVDLSKQTAGIYHLVITGASGLTRHLRVSKL